MRVIKVRKEVCLIKVTFRFYQTCTRKKTLAPGSGFSGSGSKFSGARVTHKKINVNANALFKGNW